MPIPKTIWTELWNRVATREEIGVLIRVNHAEWNDVKQFLYRHRPEGCSVARTGDPQVYFLLRPGVDLDAEHTNNALAMIRGDIQ